MQGMDNVPEEPELNQPNNSNSSGNSNSKIHQLTPRRNVNDVNVEDDQACPF